MMEKINNMRRRAKSHDVLLERPFIRLVGNLSLSILLAMLLSYDLTGLWAEGNGLSDGFLREREFIFCWEDHKTLLEQWNWCSNRNHSIWVFKKAKFFSSDVLPNACIELSGYVSPEHL